MLHSSFTMIASPTQNRQPFTTAKDQQQPLRCGGGASMHSFLSQLGVTPNSNNNTGITSFEIIVDNPKSSKVLCGRPSLLGKEDSCRWTQYSSSRTIQRRNSCENLKGLGLPKRPSSEDLLVTWDDETDEQQQPQKIVVSNRRSSCGSCGSSGSSSIDEPIKEDSQHKVYYRSRRTVTTSASKKHQQPQYHRDDDYTIGSETEYSDMLTSDDEVDTKRAKDAALSAALISTIERLSVRAALAVSRPVLSPNSARAKTLEAVDEAMTLSEPPKTTATTITTTITTTPQKVSHYSSSTTSKSTEGENDNDDDDDDDDDTSLYISNTAYATTDSEENESIVTFEDSTTSFTSPVPATRRRKYSFVSPDNMQNVNLNDDMIRQVDRIAVRAALMMTSPQDSTD
jgi:hypothetical protein